MNESMPSWAVTGPVQPCGGFAVSPPPLEEPFLGYPLALLTNRYSKVRGLELELYLSALLKHGKEK